MASIFKPRGKDKFVIVYTDESGQRRKQVGTTDKAVTERIAADLEGKVALRIAGLIDPAMERYRDHEKTSLSTHISAWQKSLIAKNYTAKHAEHTSNRVRRLVAVVLGESLDSFDTKRVAPLIELPCRSSLGRRLPRLDCRH